MGDDNEYSAVSTAEDEAKLEVKEGDDVDYRYILAAYLVADFIFVLLFIFAREEGWWVVVSPFLPLTMWMGWKVWKQRAAKPKQE